ncbi:DUF3289 family protein [Erwinia billingiae]|uniref:DUF3289 family protein n=1 Tax=Erwinia billingiae TaxID=182337 RepID=UPI003208B702
MHISPPVIWPRKDGEKYADWVMRCMPVDPKRNYPINELKAWHGGIHMPHIDTSAMANPVRAIADGMIVYARRPSENPDDLPLAYEGRTDNGCVLIRHEILVGDTPVLFTFYSLTMHMKQVRSEILSDIGKKVKREQVLGTAGFVDGKGAFHFQICCEPKMLEVLSGRIHGEVDTSEPGRSRPAFGKTYYYAPAGVPLHFGDAWLKPDTPATCIVQPLYVTDDGSRTVTFHRQPDGGYQQAGSSSTVRRIVEPSMSVKGTKTWSEWVRVALNGQMGWIDVSLETINTYTDADLPDWEGWSIIDDDPTADSQCNSKIIENWLTGDGGTKGSKLMKSICKFPFEWNFATIDTRFNWVKQKNKDIPDPLTIEDYQVFKEYIGALCFYDELPEQVQAELSGEIWHFEPRIFIIQIQKAERRLLFETKNKMNDFTADDMQHGDMTMAQILRQGSVKFMTAFYFDKNPEDHFNEMDNMAFVTAWGEYSSLIKAMIVRFRSKEGGVFRSELLDKAFIKHKTTKDCVADIGRYIDEFLVKNNGEGLSITELRSIKDSISESVRLPKFNNYDFTNGLGITIHDTYATMIYLDYVDISNGRYYLQLTFKIQDHFGLDLGDVNGKWFEYSPWFCSWFILQRYEEYGYKPFINESKFSVLIEGYL